MNITVCLEEIMQWTWGITTHILIHSCSSNICTYIIHIKYSVCNYKWLSVSTKWRARYNSNKFFFSVPNARYQEMWYNYYPIHDYNKLDIRYIASHVRNGCICRVCDSWQHLNVNIHSNRGPGLGSILLWHLLYLPKLESLVRGKGGDEWSADVIISNLTALACRCGFNTCYNGCHYGI